MVLQINYTHEKDTHGGHLIICMFCCLNLSNHLCKHGRINLAEVSNLSSILQIPSHDCTGLQG